MMLNENVNLYEEMKGVRISKLGIKHKKHFFHFKIFLK